MLVRRVIITDSDWRQINPKTSFVTFSQNDLSDLQREALDLLYQPLLGVNAYALINYLWRLSSHSKYTAEYKRKTNYEIMSVLNIDSESLYKARLHLEALGLLRTFYRGSLQDNRVFLIYELVPPLNAQDFFSEDILSLLLLDNLGEDEYEQLSNRMLGNENIKSASDIEITKNLLDVYSLNSAQLSDQPPIIKHVQKQVQKVENSSPFSPQDGDLKDFDFDLLLESLHESYVNLDDVKRAKKLINTEHLMYGINEIDMSGYIQRATDFKNDHFDLKKFKLIISRDHQQTSYGDKVNENEKRAQTTNEQINMVDNSNFNKDKLNEKPKKVEFSDHEKTLIQAARYYPPMEFLAQMKQHQGGYISTKETRIIEGLMQGFPDYLPGEVINILIYYVLFQLDNGTLKSALVDEIANQWLKSKIKTAPQALEQIRSFVHKKGQLRNKRYAKNYYNKPRVKRYVPDWLEKQDAEEKKKEEELIIKEKLKTPEQRAAEKLQEKAQIAKLKKELGVEGDDWNF